MESNHTPGWRGPPGSAGRPKGVTYGGGGGSRNTLKRLRGAHYQCVNLHLLGRTNTQIALEMGRSIAWVGDTLGDPLVKELLEQRFHQVDNELRALMPLAVGVLRENMQGLDPALQISAADKWFRANGFYQGKKVDDTRLTAEDIVKKLLEETAPGEVSKVSITVDRTGEGVE